MTVLDYLLERRKGYDPSQPRLPDGRWKIVGITDDQETCDHCGKSGLKRVVRMKPENGGEEVCFGTRCASNALGYGEGSSGQTTVTKMARAAQIERDQEAERARRRALPDTDATAWFKRMKASGGSDFPLATKLKNFIYVDSLDAELRRHFEGIGRKPGTFPWDKAKVRESHEPVLSTMLEARRP